MSPAAPATRPRIVARADRASAMLGWRPKRDDLDDIVRQALDWERRLHNRGPGLKALRAGMRRDQGSGAFAALQARLSAV